jgi:hypothetical protein
MVGMLWAGKSASPSLVEACRDGLQEEGFEKTRTSERRTDTVTTWRPCAEGRTTLYGSTSA